MYISDGTIDICQNYSSIYTCSVHSQRVFHLIKRDAWILVFLLKYDYEYLKIAIFLKKLRNNLPRYCSYDGVDVYENDKLGNLKISIEGIHQETP